LKLQKYLEKTAMTDDTSKNTIRKNGRERDYQGKEERRAGRKQARVRRPIKIMASGDNVKYCSREISRWGTR
jgi:hypothetical protein